MPCLLNSNVVEKEILHLRVKFSLNEIFDITNSLISVRSDLHLTHEG